MPRPRKDPLRPLTDEERRILEQIARAQSEPASHVARAKILLAIAAGQTYREAAGAAGRRSDEAAAKLVGRFNQAGLRALVHRPGAGAPRRYQGAEQKRILAEARRPPEREKDGTATWSLSTLQRSLHRAPDGLKGVSPFTLWMALRQAGWTWQKDRTWCETGKVKRKRKSGVVEVTDPDATVKKT